MKKVTLAKALQIKNQLVGDVAALKLQLAQQNSRPVGQKFDYDAKQLLVRLQAAIAKLVKVKAAIAVANVKIYEAIFRRAELKGLVSALAALDTKSGVFTESDYPSRLEVRYRAQLGRTQVDKLVAAGNVEIQALQDELDQFNVTTLIEV